jgi:hypothetical protein
MHHIAALLWEQGIRVVRVEAPLAPEFIFVGRAVGSVATYDADYKARLSALPAELAALIVAYVTAAR